jgi:SM-20-related protein
VSVAVTDKPESPSPLRDKSLTAPLVVLPQPFVRFENVLEPDEVSMLLERVGATRERFKPASVTDGNAEARRSEVLYDVGSVCDDFELTLAACMPVVQRIFPELGASWSTELQITAHGDGDYFTCHNDSGSPVTNARTISFVYYFNLQPARFSGGDLVLYDSPVDRLDLVSPSRHLVPPVSNTMVFFRSTAWHEVAPVACPSQAFVDRRFTINGWLSASPPST